MTVPLARSRRLTALVALLALAVALLTACGSKEEQTTTAAKVQRLDVHLDYLPNADHAPIYAAQDLGYFRQAGLDVQLHVPSDPAAPLKLAAAGKTDVAISYEPELLLARDKGLRVAAIGALVQQPLTSIMSLNGKVKTPADLKGKRVGTAGIPYQSAYLKTIAEQAGVDPASIREVNVGFGLVGSMLSKKVDATLGAFWNVEGVQLRLQKKNPTIIRMDQAGVPTYQELVFVARDETMRERGDALRRFLQAVSRGAKAVRRDVRVGAEALTKANPDLRMTSQVEEIRATLPAFFPTDERFPWGFQNTDEWKAYGDWMLQQGLLEQAPSPTSLTNEFLPGRGV